MKLKNILADFLDGQSFYLAIFNSDVYIYKAKDIDTYTSQKIIIVLENFKIVVTGENLSINKFIDGELSITGDITGVMKINE